MEPLSGTADSFHLAGMKKFCKQIFDRPSNFLRLRHRRCVRVVQLCKRNSSVASTFWSFSTQQLADSPAEFYHTSIIVEVGQQWVDADQSLGLRRVEIADQTLLCTGPPTGAFSHIVRFFFKSVFSRWVEVFLCPRVSFLI